MAIGSGGNYALAAARALVDTEMDAEAIVRAGAGHRRRNLRLHQLATSIDRERSKRDLPMPLAPIARPRPTAPMTTFSPREIVSELDRYIVGQNDAKRAVAIALRNRWRRQQLDGPMREEVLPKNILMIGPTGVGKTEISPPPRQARRRAVPQGRGDEVHRGRLCRPRRRADHARPGRGRHRPRARGASARRCRPRRICGRGARARRAGRASGEPADARELPPASCAPASSTTRRSRSRCSRRAGGMPMFEMPGMPGASIGVINPSATCSARPSAGRTKTRRTTVKEAYEPLIDEEADKLLDQEQIVQEAMRRSRTTASSSSTRSTRSPRREGRARRRRVARRRAARPAAADRGHDRFHQARPGEDRPHPVHRVRRLPRREAVRPLPELQGRLPIRVELRPLTRERFPPHPDRDRRRA